MKRTRKKESNSSTASSRNRKGGKPVQLANALMKISGTMQRVPNRDLRKVEGLNAFFIIPVNSGRQTIANLFSTHPPVQMRVQKLLEMEASMA